MPDPITETPPAPPALSKEDLSALIAKHRLEIERIKGLDAERQKEVFAQLGVDPRALEDHYSDLERKAAELRRQDERANQKVTASGWASLVAGGLGMFALRKKLSDVKIVQWFAVGLSSLTAAFFGTLAASRVFTGKIRVESRQLGTQARNAFERELAVALENREREGMVAALGSAHEQSAAPATNIPKRDASFVAQAVADKAAAIPLQTRA